MLASIRKYGLPGLVLAFVLAGTAAHAAEPVKDRQEVVQEISQSVDQARKQLEEERAKQERELAALRPDDVTPTLLEQAQLDFDAARVELESASLDLQAAEQTVSELQKGIADGNQKLQSGSVTGAAAERLRQNLKEAGARLKVEREHLRSRREAYALAELRRNLARQRLERLTELQRMARAHDQRVALEDLQKRLEAEQQAWLGKAAELRKKHESADAPADDLLGLRIQDAEARARLAQMRLRLAQIEARVEAAGATPASAEVPPEQLKKVLDQTRAALGDLKAQRELLTRKIQVVRQQMELVQKRAVTGDDGQTKQEKRLLERLLRSHTELLDAYDAALAQVGRRPAELEAAYQASVHRGLLARRTLPEDSAGWQQLSGRLLALPARLLQGLASSADQSLSALVGMSADRWLLALLGSAFWLALSVRALRLLRRRREVEAGDEAEGFTAGLFRMPAELLRRTGPSLIPGGALAILLLAPEGAGAAQAPLLSLLAAWVGATTLIATAGALLTASYVPEAYRRPALYRQLRAMLIGGGAFAAVTALVHLGDFSPGVRDLIDRCFMLALAAITVPALEARRLALDLIEPRLGETYWMRVIRLFSLAAPVSILAGTAVGIAGYVNLAWTIGKYLGLLLGLLGAWLVLGRLLRDAMAQLKDYANSNSSNGLLWAQAVIQPLHNLGRVGLFIALWLVPLRLLGVLDGAGPFAAMLRDALQTPLFSIGGTPIHAQGILLSALLAVAVIGFGRWVRMVTFRWAFARIADMGMRHSLSVFAQYAVVVAGVLIALRLLGIDLTTLAIFAGAVGVGIGFGLQTIANNFISGLLLLIERPLRTNDIVRVGQNEGEVTHIGMRSLTVKTWDNQEVIIPNSDVISTAFTNWTHSDDIVRTVVVIGVSYDSDPHRARDLILGVLQRHAAVMRDPEPQVWLQEFASSSVNFHVQYFMDLRLYSRLEVKSEVLFGVWDAFREAGIRIPYPQQDVYIRAMPGSDTGTDTAPPQLPSETLQLRAGER